jgi:hypothetical protein
MLPYLLAILAILPRMQANPPRSVPAAARRFRQHHLPFRLRHTSNPPQPKPKYWGDYLGPKDPEHLRLYLPNPNRISACENFTDFEYLCQNLSSSDIDIFVYPRLGLTGNNTTLAIDADKS